MKHLSLSLLLIFLPLISLARIIPVSSYASLQGACQTAIPGDTIRIAPGTYTVNGVSRIMITDRPGPVLVQGETGNPQDVIVEGKGQDNEAVQMVFNLDNSPEWTFEALTTKNSYYHGFKFDHASTDCVLRNIIMLDHGESGVKGTSDPSSGTYPDRLLIENCLIGFTKPSGGTRSVVEGVDGVGVNDWVIRNSRFVNIQKGGAPAYAIFTKGNSSNTIIEANVFENCFIAASFGGGGTGDPFFRDNDRTYEHSGGIIRNNIMIRCSDAGVYINKGREARVYNNTLFECELTIQLRFEESSGWVRNNLVLRSPDNPNEPVVRSRDGATIFADEANLAATADDFRIASGGNGAIDIRLVNTSPAIDAGVDAGIFVPTDFEGDKRPFGEGYDVGADEYVATVSVPNEIPGSGNPEVLLWPQPVVGGHLYVKIDGESAPSIFTFHALNGQQVLRVVMQQSDGNARGLDVSALPSGLYLMTMETSTGVASRIVTICR